MSNGYYSVEYKNNSGHFYLFLFKPIGRACENDLSAVIKRSIRKVLFPDALIFVCIEKEKDDLLKILKNDPSTLQELERCSTKISVGVSVLNQSGEILKPDFVIDNKKHELEKPLSSSKQENIFHEGLTSLFSIDKVIEFAPPNFTFKKLSGANSNYFIKTEAALIEVEDVFFLAYSLLKKIKERDNETKDIIEVIYIDTMAISSLAYAIRELYIYFSKGKANPRIISFHSYDCIQKAKPPKGSSLCLISASASMNMQREWIKLTRCYNTEVITLLTSIDASDYSSALHSIKIKNKDFELHVTPDHNIGKKEIRIYGERFTAEQAQIKKVILRLPTHRNTELFKNAPTYSKDNLFAVMEEKKAILVNGQKLIKTESFTSFLENQLLQQFPLSTKVIVYQDDNASKELADLCLNDIKKVIPSINDTDLPIIINQKKLNEDSTIDSLRKHKDKAFLIVAAVIGKGTELLSISRDLREIHTGAKNYLVGFQIAESIFDREKLNDNLVYSSTGSKNTLNMFGSYAIGSNLKSSYKEDNSESIPFHKSSKDNKPLRLRDDFTMWNTDYNSKENHSETVLLTISSILQYAREYQGFKSNKYRLASDTLQQVVLDPENFSRFNDGIIQAALLRSALPQELDYSSDQETSRHMLGIIKNIFKSCDREQGEVSYEMAHALKTGKLKISNSDLEKLKEFFYNDCDSEKECIKNIKDILYPELGIERPI